MASEAELPKFDECMRDLYALHLDESIAATQIVYAGDRQSLLAGYKTLASLYVWDLPKMYFDCSRRASEEQPKLLKILSEVKTRDFFWNHVTEWAAAREQILQARAGRAFALAGHIFGKTLVETTLGPRNGILPDILPDVLPPIVIPDKVNAAADILAGVLLGITKREDLDQLNECFYGADEFLYDFITAWNDIASETFAGLINGATLMMETIMYIPHDIYECALSGEDFREFLAWASIIETPEILVQTVEYNMKRHLAALTIEMNKARKDMAYGAWTYFVTNMLLEWT